MRRPFENWSIDLKSLACLRLMMALIIGLAVLPNLDSAISSTDWPKFQSSVFWSGIAEVFRYVPALALFIKVLAMAGSLLLLVGYCTRVATAACLLFCSLAAVMGIGQFWLLDDLLLPLLFWSVFLPLGAAYSLDSAMNTARESQPMSIISGATIALMIQQVLNYWLPDLLFWSATFGPNALAMTGASSIVIWGMGLLAPLMLFLPVDAHVLRRILVGLMVCIHGFAMLGLQQPVLIHLVAIALWSAFVPSSVWQALRTVIDSPARRGLVIYYDADCGFCKKVVHVLRTLLILPGTPLLTAQSDDSICADMELQNSWVVVDWQQQRHFKFAAIAYICSLSPVFWGLAPVLRLPPVMSVGTRFYEAIAKNRKRAAVLTKPLKFESRSVKLSRLETWIVALGIAAYLVVHLPILAQTLTTALT